MSIDVVFKLIQSARYELAPTKYVVLIDLDGKDPGCVLNPLRSGIETRLDEHLNSQVKYAYAQWHLEAWYFGDAENLREYLGGRALGSVDSSQPDTIHNPKLHLRNLLGDEFYTARISEAIAKKLNPSTIAGRSPSFKVFLTSVMNGAHQLERE